MSKSYWIDGGKRLVIRNGNKKWPPQSKMAANQWPPINGRQSMAVVIQNGSQSTL